MSEVTKELMDKIFEVIELAKSSGKIRKGVNEVTKSIERGEAKLVVVAGDITPVEITMHLPLLADEKGIKHITIDKKEELGAAAGLGVATASVAIIKEGEGKDILKDILNQL